MKKEARTIIPDQAIAEIDVRLVKESDPHRLINLIKNHIIKQGAYVIENRNPTEEERLKNSNIIRFDSKVSYLAFRTEIDSPIGNWASSALKKAFGRPPIKIRTSGGSIPISAFVDQTLRFLCYKNWLNLGCPVQIFNFFNLYNTIDIF